ncbi:MAG: metallophosphoesterase family protein [Nitrospinae bacterium]|nr:metallophosphoesterase family protein [Nitrospinota bacterium]
MNPRRVTNRLIGVISDTHGIVRPEAVQALQGMDLLIHAGDIGQPEVLEALRSLAPVAAVRGNNDRGEWANGLPETEVVEIGQVLIYILHDVKDLTFDPAAAGFSAVISGHSHCPSVKERGGALFVNPGSAGPRRFKLPVAVARLRVHGTLVDAEVVELDV